MQGKQAVNIPEIRKFEAVSYKRPAFAPQAIYRGVGPCRLDFNKPQEPTLEQEGEPGSSLLLFVLMSLSTSDFTNHNLKLKVDHDILIAANPDLWRT